MELEQATILAEKLADSEYILFKLAISKSWVIDIQISAMILIAIGLVLLVFLVAIFRKYRISDVEIDSAEFGIGNHKISITPNTVDRQIAYAIWVELSTRKIGLKVDLDHDVISEIYDSWYTFFGVCRELLKEVPATKLNAKSTREIVKLSISILNDGLRPHLTSWQARYRHWHEQVLDKNSEKAPQDLQREFPRFDELSSDLMKINFELILFRKKMYQLVTGRDE